MFSVFNIAGSGLTLHRTWLDAVADNIANINTAVPGGEAAYQERFVVAQAQSSNTMGGSKISGGANGTTPQGVKIAGVEFGSSDGELRHEPNNPLADANGYVRYPAMNLADQMTNMIAAQRGYQANLSVIERARAAYEAAINLGK